MDDRFIALAAATADRHGVFTTAMAQRFGVSDRLRNEWLALGWINRLGIHTFQFAGSPRTGKMTLASALGDAGSESAVSGRSVGALHHLDGFIQGPVEIWVPRTSRNRRHGFVTRSSARPLSILRSAGVTAAA